MRVAELQQHEDELGFRPEEPVRWLSPSELWKAAVKVALSSVFASYADKRESQAALPVPRPVPAGRLTANGDLWLDFVADLGDGFDATYTVACLLAQAELDPLVPEGDGRAGPLPRASVLVLGGDEVYPTASAREYENRMKGPYAAALPLDSVRAEDRPRMYVLPGNHDWYDGLTAFLRTFAQGRWIGAWRTEQKRSYFALHLRPGWWLLGLDSQLGYDLDEPQLRFFEEHVTSQLQDGDSVVLCAAAPSWVHTEEKGDADAFSPLHWFDRHYIRTRPTPDGDDREPTGASVRLWITGDSHHYARFAERLAGDRPAAEEDSDQAAGREPSLRPDPERRQMVTCGLGGAFLAATHNLPESLPLPPEKARLREKDEPVDFARAEVCYPDRETSARWARRLAQPWSPYWLLKRNPGFGWLAGGVHVALFLGLSGLLGLTTGSGPVAALRTAAVADAWVVCAWVVGPVAAVLLLQWARQPAAIRTKLPPATAVAAVLSQLLVACAVLVLAVAARLPEQGWGWLVLLVGCVCAWVAGCLLGTEAFALYALLARSGEVFGWQMSGQAVEDDKGFVRMRIDATGTLTLYPLVVDAVCHEWELDPDPRTEPGARPRRPVPAGPLPVPRLLEDPVVIAPTRPRVDHAAPPDVSTPSAGPAARAGEDRVTAG
jgi:hypothetical protein